MSSLKFIQGENCKTAVRCVKCGGDGVGASRVGGAGVRAYIIA